MLFDWPMMLAPIFSLLFYVSCILLSFRRLVFQPIMSPNENHINVGKFPPDIWTQDIKDLFNEFGEIVFIDFTNCKGLPFAFVEFEDPG